MITLSSYEIVTSMNQKGFSSIIIVTTLVLLAAGSVLAYLNFASLLSYGNKTSANLKDTNSPMIMESNGESITLADVVLSEKAPYTRKTTITLTT